MFVSVCLHSQHVSQSCCTHLITHPSHTRCLDTRDVEMNASSVITTLTHQIHDNWVAYSRIWSRRSLHRFYGRVQTYGKRSGVYTKAIVRHADIRDTNPSLGMTCPGDPHQRSPNAPKFDDGKSDVPVKQRGGWPRMS